MSALQAAGEFFGYDQIELPPQTQMVANGAIWGIFGLCIETLYPANPSGVYTAASIGFGALEELGEAYLKARFPKKYSFLNPLLSTSVMSAVLVGGACLSDHLPIPIKAAFTVGTLFSLTVSMPKIAIKSPCYSRMLGFLPMKLV